MHHETEAAPPFEYYYARQRTPSSCSASSCTSTTNSWLVTTQELLSKRTILASQNNNLVEIVLKASIPLHLQTIYWKTWHWCIVCKGTMVLNLISIKSFLLLWCITTGTCTGGITKMLQWPAIAKDAHLGKQGIPEPLVHWCQLRYSSGTNLLFTQDASLSQCCLVWQQNAAE